MKKHFATGLAILLPIVLTFLIASFFLHFLTKPFLGLTEQTLAFIAGKDHFLARHPGLLKLASEVSILILLVGFISLIGLAAKYLFVNMFFNLTDRMLHTIPVVNKIYKAVQDVINGVISPSKPSFSQVVIVPFPNPKSQALGFVTREGGAGELISVFVPGTPNPTIGFMLMFAREKLIFTDFKVEEALKFIVSCGVILEKKQPDIS